MAEQTPLNERIPELVAYIRKHDKYLEHNNQLFTIKEGRLLPFILSALKKSLSDNYYKTIEERVVPINILIRLMQKLSKAYLNDPIREATTKIASDQELLDEYVDWFEMDCEGQEADENANLYKGYAWEPYLESKGKPKLRTIPFNSFLVKGDDFNNPLKMTVFLKSMGNITVTKGGKSHEEALWYAYTATEFTAFTMSEEIFQPALAENDGVNPFDEIPFMYGNRSKSRILPIQDTDLKPMTLVIPILMTDLSGAIQFQCFSIIWGIDVDSENLTMSPNAFWSLKSDSKSDKQPQVGQLKPQADIDKVLKYVKDTFSFWLESKGVRVGSMGGLSADNMVSGFSKIIDEMDTTALVKKSIQAFQKEEARFWQLVKTMHNKWVDQGEMPGKPKFSENFAVTISFDEPQPKIDRATLVKVVREEVDAGFLDMETALMRLYPDLTPDQIKERLAKVALDKAIMITSSEEQGHTHEGMGPAIPAENGHTHEMSDGSGRVSTEDDLPGHQHEQPNGEMSGPPTESNEEE